MTANWPRLSCSLPGSLQSSQTCLYLKTRFPDENRVVSCVVKWWKWPNVWLWKLVAALMRTEHLLGPAVERSQESWTRGYNLRWSQKRVESFHNAFLGKACLSVGNKCWKQQIWNGLEPILKPFYSESNSSCTRVIILWQMLPLNFLSHSFFFMNHLQLMDMIFWIIVFSPNW